MAVFSPSEFETIPVHERDLVIETAEKYVKDYGMEALLIYREKFRDEVEFMVGFLRDDRKK